MKDAYVFGHGRYYQIKINSIEKEYKIIGIIDNAAKENEYSKGVYLPDKICEDKNALVIILSRCFIPMWRQLKELGVEDNRILFGITMPPFCSIQEELDFGQGVQIKSEGKYLVYIAKSGKKYSFSTEEELRAIFRNEVQKRTEDVSKIAHLDIVPTSRDYGSERGKAVDRYYIEQFLSENQYYIHGTVMEIADDQYIRKYGNSVENRIVGHVEAWGNGTIKCNLESGEGIKDEMVDCFICTQTLQYIFDLSAAVRNIYRLLKRGGTALITVPGIKGLCIPEQVNWGEYWSFTKDSMNKLCESICQNYSVESYGNVKTTTAYLYGICCEELTTEDFRYNDEQYPLIIVAKIQKPR